MSSRSPDPIAPVPSTGDTPLSEVILGRARVVADARLGEWSPERTAALETAFERAATEALRAPVLAERSIHLRRIAKILLPSAARPAARRLVKKFDALSRTVVDAIGRHR